MRATVTCTGKPGKEADGEPVTYEASNLTDGVADTSWRCGGKALGERVTLKLGEKVPVDRSGWSRATRRPTRRPTQTASRRTTASGGWLVYR